MPVLVTNLDVLFSKVNRLGDGSLGEVGRRITPSCQTLSGACTIFSYNDRNLPILSLNRIVETNLYSQKYRKHCGAKT